MENQLLSHNSDFLFLFEAIQCNPNGDPDQENKPRMDYETQTNLVSDVRIKRYIRDYLRESGQQIFVDLESEAKVTMDDRLAAVLKRLFQNSERVAELLDNKEFEEEYSQLLQNELDLDRLIKSSFVNKKPKNKELNLALLAALVKYQFVDVRMFGSAFAIDGFNRSYTGPIQLNWGYSLNKAYLMESNTVSSIMNDGNSTFGKDHRIKYSLIAFHGSINRAAAKHTGLTDDDLKSFRKALWESLSAMPTRSKLNQYPKLYVEVVYNEGYHNGQLGDLRNWIGLSYTDGIEPRAVSRLSDLHVDFSRLKQAIEQHSGEGKAIREVIVKQSADLSF